MGTGSGFDEGKEGVDAVDDAEEVGLEDLVEIGRLGPGAAEADASVEGEQGEVAWWFWLGSANGILRGSGRKDFHYICTLVRHDNQISMTPRF